MYIYIYIYILKDNIQYVYRCARHRYGLQEGTVTIELLFTGFQFLFQATLASSLRSPFSPPPLPEWVAIPSSGIFLTQIEPGSLTLQADSLPLGEALKL